jgi:adiponectin receptor
MPAVMQNQFILSGYRLGFSLRGTLRSLMMLHNETINIWTHLLPLVLVVFVIGYVVLGLEGEQALASFLGYIRLKASLGYQELEEFGILALAYQLKDMEVGLAEAEFHKRVAEHQVERWPIVVFLCCACACLLSSAVYHLFINFSLRTELYLRRLDYAGINFLISGTGIPLIYYAYYCRPETARYYCTISITTAVVLFSVSLTEAFHSERLRYVRVVLYGGFGVSAALPLLGMADPLDPFRAYAALPLYLCMGAAYLVGLAIYAVRCPERFSPGRFDLVGHSHQLWHIGVVLGIITSYFATLVCYYQRQLYPLCRVQ